MGILGISGRVAAATVPSLVVLSDLVHQVMSGDQVLVTALLNPTLHQGFQLHTALSGSMASRTTCIQQEDKLRAVSLECNSLYIEGMSCNESRVHESYRRVM